MMLYSRPQTPSSYVYNILQECQTFEHLPSLTSQLLIHASFAEFCWPLQSCYYWKVVSPCKQTYHRASLSSLYRKSLHQPQPGIESKLLFLSTNSHNHLIARAFNIFFFAFSASLTQGLSFGHDDTSLTLLIDVIIKT